MKNLILSIITVIVVLCASAVRAEQTNSPSTLAAIGSNTNVQGAIVSILMGAKNVGGDIYDASKSAIAASVDMVKSQAPELVTEFLKWKFAEALTFVVMGAILLIAGLWMAYVGWRMDDADAGVLVFIFLGLLPILGGLIVIGVNAMTVIQIWIAPKIYLIEYIVNIVKNH